MDSTTDPVGANEPYEQREKLDKIAGAKQPDGLARQPHGEKDLESGDTHAGVEQGDSRAWKMTEFIGIYWSVLFLSTFAIHRLMKLGGWLREDARLDIWDPLVMGGPIGGFIASLHLNFYRKRAPEPSEASSDAPPAVKQGVSQLWKYIHLTVVFWSIFLPGVFGFSLLARQVGWHNADDRSSDFWLITPMYGSITFALSVYSTFASDKYPGSSKAASNAPMATSKQDGSRAWQMIQFILIFWTVFCFTALAVDQHNDARFSLWEGSLVMSGPINTFVYSFYWTFFGSEKRPSISGPSNDTPSEVKQGGSRAWEMTKFILTFWSVTFLIAFVLNYHGYATYSLWDPLALSGPINAFVFSFHWTFFGSR